METIDITDMKAEDVLALMREQVKIKGQSVTIGELIAKMKNDNGIAHCPEHQGD